MLDSAHTQQQLQVLRRQDVRTRSCAALVFAFHGGLGPPVPVRPGTVPRAVASIRRAPSASLPAFGHEEMFDETPTRTAYEILKWVGMIAAVAAPWVLLLTG